MATTEHFYAGTGTQTSFPFEFPYLTESDVFVKLYNSSTGNFDLKQQNTSGQNNDYSISNTNIVFNTAPPQIAGVNNIHIYRNTDVETAKAVYNTGSAIRAQDLNNNTDQSLYKLQEGTQLINTEDIKDEAINSAKIKDETIVNADVSPTAEIAVSKLADGSARQLLQTDAAGSGVEWASNIDIPGTLDVTGNTDIDGNLNVDGTVTAGGNVTTTGNLAAGGTLNVSNNTSLSGTLAVTGASTFTGAIDANGGAAIDNIRIGVSANNEIDTSSGNLIIDSATGTTTVDDNLAVTGDLTVTGSITAPLWNGAALADFWLTSSQDIDHRGQTIQIAKVSNSNATHRFSIANDYEFEVGKRVTEGHTYGAFGNGTMQPCFQLKHRIEQTGYRKSLGTSYQEVDHEEFGDLNLGIGTYSGMTGNDDTIDNFKIKHAHLVFLGRKGFPAANDPDGQQNPNSVSTLTPTLVLSGQRGAMFTHPNNTTFMRTSGSSTYSGLGYLATGAYTLGGRSINDQYNWGNNGYFSGYEGQALLESAVDFQIIVGGARAKDRFEIGSSSVTGTLALSGVDITANATQLNVLDGLTSNTSELNKLDGFTGSTTDLNEVVTGKNVVETITGSATDTQLPTAQAVNERIVELVTEVGGFHPIANETSFPTTNPDINDGAGTIVSVKALASNLTSNGSGVATIANGAGTGNTVTINGMANNDTIESGKGILLETTTTLHTYNFHREIVDSAGVATADALVSAFNERYYGPYSANQSTRPSGANRLNGDLYFNTSDGKMKVFNGSHASGTWDDVAAPGNFFINTLSSSSGSGGGSAAFNNNATRFTLSNPPLTAQQLLVSVNGVIQKPNSGTSPSEGFAIDGADIIFASAPATGAPHFIVTIGSSVNIGTPSNDTVGAAQIIDGSISNAEISSSAAIAKSKIETFVNTNADNRVITGSDTANTLNGEAGLTFNNSILSNAGSGYKEIAIAASTNNSSTLRLQNSSANFTISNITGGTFSVADGGTSRLAIDSNGNIGLGTSTPSAILHINSSDNTLAYLQSTDAFAAMYMADTNGSVGLVTTLGKLEFRTGGDASTEGTNATAKMIIKADGKVGIGTTSPTEVLHVTTPASTDKFPIKWISGGSSVAGYLYSDSVGSGITGSGKVLNEVGIYMVNNSRMDFRVNGSERMRIESNGNVGIGTTTPSTKFEVRDSGGTGISSRSTSTQTTDGNKALKVRNNSDTDTFNVSYKGQGYFAGRLGIGTTSPSAPLHIESDANTGFVVESTDRYSTAYLVDSVGSTFIQCDSGVLRFGVGGDAGSTSNVSEAMRIGSTGLVGIGTNSPQNNLHIHGSTPAIRLSDSDNSSAYSLFDANGANLNIHADKGNAVANSTIGFGIDNSIKMTLSSLGRLGIGTTNPDTKLDVARLGSAWTGSDPASGTVAHFHNGNNATTSPAYIGIGSGSSSISGILFGDEADADVGQIRYAHSDNSMRVFTNAAERLRVNSEGKVGIGETSPDAYLHISDGGANDRAVLKLDTFRPKIRFQDRSTGASDGEILVDGSAIRFNLSEAVDDNTPCTERMRITAGGLHLGGTSAANAIDDYEEGTWTPSPEFGDGSTGMSYTTLNCVYTKIGRTVTVKGSVNFTNKGSSTGTLKVNGLPFAGTSGSYSHFTGACITFNGPNTDGTMNCFVSSSSIRFRMHNDANSNLKPQHTDFDNDTKFMFTVTYFV